MPAMSLLERVVCTISPYRLLARRVVLPWALQGWRIDGSALEIGCGSGAMAAQLLTQFPGLNLTATDFDPQMVGVAQRLLARFGARGIVQQADATQLPFDDGRFDAVLSFAMLHHVVDWEAAIAEAVRVLRPGGHLIGYDFLDTPVLRFLHSGDRRGTRLMSSDQLRHQLQTLPVNDVRMRPSGAGSALRFAATSVVTPPSRPA